MTDRPLVLITNDDGFDSPGIRELALACSVVGDVLMAAPIKHHSGTGRGIPFGASFDGSGIIEEREIELSEDVSITAYAVDGTPALSVAHAVLEIAQRKPDICISGVNFGENVGRALHYSGTIGAAMEAADFGIPSIAVSQELPLNIIESFEGEKELFTQAALIAARLAQQLLDDPIDSDVVCLNLNIPLGANMDTPIEITHQCSLGRWEWFALEAKRDFSKPHQLFCDNVGDRVWPEGSDVHALLINKHVSLTPLTWSMEARDGEIDRNALTKKFT